MDNELPEAIKEKDPQYAAWASKHNLDKPRPNTVDSPSFGSIFGKTMGEAKFPKNLANLYSTMTFQNPVAAGLTGIAGGAIPAYLGSKLYNYFNPDEEVDETVPTVAGGALGLLANLGMHYAAQPDAPPVKKAYFSSYGSATGSLDRIATKISYDPNINQNEESQLLQMIQGLPPQHQQELSSLLGSASGAAVGMIIARYLLKLGLGSQLLLSLAGGAIGYGMSQNWLASTATGSQNRQYTL